MFKSLLPKSLVSCRLWHAAALVVVVAFNSGKVVAEDSCSNEDSFLQSTYGAHFVCATLGLSDSVQPLDCSALGPLCPVSCGFCDGLVRVECTPDEIFRNKWHLTEFLRKLGACGNCQALAVEVADMLYVEKGRVSGGYSTLDPRDPCFVDGVTCDRCGAVRDILLAPSGDDSLSGFISSDLSRFSSLSVLSVQGPEDQAFNQPAPWLPEAVWKDLTNITVVELRDIFRGDVPALHHSRALSSVRIENAVLAGDINSLFGSPSMQSLVVANILSGGSDGIVAPKPLQNRFCHMASLMVLELPPLTLTGDIPRCLEGMQMLRHVAMSGQSMLGPVSLFLRSLALEHLELTNLTLTGTLSSALSDMTQLRNLLLGHNAITGVLPSLARLSYLEHLQLQHNQLTGAETLAGNGLSANFSYNLLLRLPQDWTEMHGVQSLDLSHNFLSSWPPAGVYARGIISGEGVPTTTCQDPKSPYFDWPNIRWLSIAHNPLHGVDVRDVLGSLATLPSIQTLNVSSCGLARDLPREGEYVLPQFRDLAVCTGNVPLRGFPALVILDASNNAIEGIGGGPPNLLQRADFSNNNVTVLQHYWWTTDAVQSVSFLGNPHLRLAVQAPSLSGLCDRSTQNFYANARGYSSALSPDPNRSECTSLCVTQRINWKVDPVANPAAMCRCKAGWFGFGLDCESAPANFWAPPGSQLPVPCPANSSTLGLQGQGSESACKCDAGFYASFETADPGNGIESAFPKLRCQLCPANTIRTSPGALSAQECEPCEAGYASEPGERQCRQCLIGSVASAGLGSGCRECDPGKFAASQTSTACTNCPLGQYQNETGASACKRCAGEGMSTWSLQLSDSGSYMRLASAASESHCGCEDGRLFDSNQCKVCGVGEFEGLICPGGITNDGVLLQRGYFSNGPEISIFRCWHEHDSCPGHRRPGNACAAGRVGLQCAECEDGKVPSDGGSCKTCTFGVGLVLPLFLILLLVGASCLYAVMDLQTKKPMMTSGYMLMGTSILSLVLVAMQQMGVIAQLADSWYAPLRTLIELMSILTFDIEILNMGCVGKVSQLEMFALRLCVILMGVGLMCLVHLMVVVFGCKCNFRRQTPTLLSALGTVCFAFYTALVNTLTGPFQCQSHPNGRWTSRGYPSVECWNSSTHRTMIILSAISVTVPVAFLAGVCWVVFEHPKRVKDADTEFLRSFRFLIVRFKPQTVWYAIAVVVRGLFLSVCPAIPNTSAATFTAQVVLLCSLLLLARFYPWRVVSANYLDLCLTMGMILVVNLGSHEVDAYTDAQRALSWVAGIALCSVFVAMILFLIGRFVYLVAFRQKKFRFFLCHYKAQAGAFARLLKTLLAEGSTPHYAFLDCDDLQDLSTLFTHVAKDTQTLVVLNSGQILFRPWCAGEITTAHFKRVEVLPVRMPDYQEISQDALRDYGTLVDVSCLTEVGISMATLVTSLSWYERLRGLKFVGRMSNTMASALVHAISHTDVGSLKSTRLVEPADTLPQATFTAIVVDQSQQEVVAGALVLERLLGSIFLLDNAIASWRPRTVENDTQQLPEETRAVLFFFSAGCFEGEMFLALLGDAAARNTPALPILGQDTFRVPSKDDMNEVQAKAGSDCMGHYVIHMFKTIAKFFNAPYGSITELDLVAQSVATRLRRLVQKAEGRQHRTSLTSNGSVSAGQRLSGRSSVRSSDSQQSHRSSRSSSASAPASANSRDGSQEEPSNAGVAVI